MRVHWLSLPALMLCGVCAWSQAHSSPEFDARRYQIYGGAAFTGSNPSENTQGFGFGFGGDFNRRAGVQGEFTVVRSSCCVVNTVTLIDFLAGPRLAQPLSRSSRVGLFADFLVGAQHVDNSDARQHSFLYRNGAGPAAALDGGLDFRVSSRLALRAQAGGVFSQFAGAGAASRWRAGTFLVYRF
jgi:hypothetical protein